MSLEHRVSPLARSTGHEKYRVTVCLAAKANGQKIKPFIVGSHSLWEKRCEEDESRSSPIRKVTQTDTNKEDVGDIAVCKLKTLRSSHLLAPTSFIHCLCDFC